MWATVDAAVQEGWQPTLRLLSVIVALGVLATAAAAIAGESAAVRIVGSLLTGS